MTTFVLATNRTWYDPNGGKQSQAEFHNMLAWGKIAEIAQKFLQKSTLVYIEGYLKTRSWENDQGQRIYRTEVVIQDILVLDRGIRHDSSSNTGAEATVSEFSSDHESDDALFGDEKPVTEIEKSFQEKLSEGNDTVADASLDAAENTTDRLPSFDEPLFEEETK